MKSRPNQKCPACVREGRSTLCRHRTPLRSERSPERRKRMPARNAKRKRLAFARDFHSSAFVAWIHGFPCCHCGAYGWTEAAHVKRRSQGGTVEDNIVPLCGNRTGVKGCHQQFDEHELDEHRLRFSTLAKELWRSWCARNPNEQEGV